MIALRVSDIKQYAYCPRVVYFHYVRPVGAKSTFKMEYGKREEARVERLETRRGLARYGLDGGKRSFHVALSSSRLGLSGRVDMLVETDEACFPVDFKFTRGRPARNHVYQVAGYGLLLEDIYGKEAPRGFVYLIPSDEAVAFELHGSLKDDIMAMLAEMRLMIAEESMPPPADNRNKCVDCEYRNFCRDVF